MHLTITPSQLACSSSLPPNACMHLIITPYYKVTAYPQRIRRPLLLPLPPRIHPRRSCCTQSQTSPFLLPPRIYPRRSCCTQSQTIPFTPPPRMYPRRSCCTCTRSQTSPFSHLRGRASSLHSYHTRCGRLWRAPHCLLPCCCLLLLSLLRLLRAWLHLLYHDPRARVLRPPIEHPLSMPTRLPAWPGGAGGTLSGIPLGG